jgi:predicted ATPase
MTQEQVATRAGLSVRAVSDLERGVRLRARTYTIRRLADALAIDDVDRSELFRLAQSPPETGLGSYPLPASLEVTERSPLVGRRSELGALERAWNESNGGNLTLIEGDSGSGKSRLCREFARGIQARGGIVLAGVCDEHAMAAYGAWVEVLRPVAVPGWDESRARLIETAPVLSSFAPPTGGRRAVENPDSSRPAEPLHVAEALLSALHRTVQVAPVLVVLEDLQWADRWTALVLRYLSRVGVPAGATVLGTYQRSTAAREPLVQNVMTDLHRRPGAARICIEELSQEEVLQLLEARGVESPSVGFLAWAHRQAGGNPLLLEEMLEDLLATGGSNSSAAEGDAVKVSTGISEFVEQRLFRLSESVGQVLAVGAVIGRVFDLFTLEAVTVRPTEALIDALDAAVTDHLLRETSSGQYEFCHDLVRQAIYQSMSHTRQAWLHERITESVGRLAEANLTPNLVAHGSPERSPVATGFAPSS